MCDTGVTVFACCTYLLTVLEGATRMQALTAARFDGILAHVTFTLPLRGDG